MPCLRPFPSSALDTRYFYNPNFLRVFLCYNYRIGHITHSKADYAEAKLHYLDNTRGPGYRGKMGKVL